MKSNSPGTARAGTRWGHTPCPRRATRAGTRWGHTPCPRRAARPSAAAAQRGFTLLEVMCAFAILAGLTGFLTQVFFKAMRSGTLAFHLRELREASDTLFRRIVYEEHKFADGDSATMDVAYANWLYDDRPAPVSERVKWERYRYTLEKKRVTAGGTPDQSKDESDLFEGSSGDHSSSDESETPAEDQGPPAEALWKLTLKIFDVDDMNEPLLTLRTYIPVRDTAATGTAPK